MKRLLFGLIVMMGLLLGPVSDTRAQGIGGLLTGSGNAQSDTDFDAIMRSAAENGVSVVVIDRDGTVLSQSSGVEAEAEIARDGTALMDMQTTAVQFRAALIDRLVNLPEAFHEVGVILRAASPDGTIMAFVWTLLMALMLFVPGMIVQQEIYGKRLVKNFVISRILENPVGYREKMPFLVFRFVMGVIGIVVSMAVAYVIGYTFLPPLTDPALQFTVVLINIGFLPAELSAGFGG